MFGPNQNDFAYPQQVLQGAWRPPSGDLGMRQMPAPHQQYPAFANAMSPTMEMPQSGFYPPGDFF